MQFLVTRPETEARVVADRLTAAGHGALVAPVLTIRFVDQAGLDLTDVQAIAVTSRNGVTALAKATAQRAMPVLTVGEATAAAARAAGFTNVAAADGDVVSLAPLIRETHLPIDGTILHASGSDVAGDLAGDLERGGFATRRVVLYEAVAAASLTPEAERALRAGVIDGVLLYSPRSAAAFAVLLSEAGLEVAAEAMTAFCLSSAVATAAATLNWRAVQIAPQPTSDSLIDLALAVAHTGTKPMVAESPPPPVEPLPRLEPPLPLPPPAETRRRRGIGGVFIFVFTVIAAAVVAAAVSWYVPQFRGTPPEVALLETETATRLGAVEQRIAALTTQFDVLFRDVDPKAITARAESYEQRLVRVEQGMAAVFGLSDRVARLEDPARAAGQADRLTQLESRLAALAAATGDEASIDRMRERLATLERSLGETGDASQRLTAVEDRLRALGTNADTIAALRGRLDAVEARQQSQAGQSAALLALVQLRDQVATGAGFATALDAARGHLGALTPEIQAALAALQPLAQAGAPTLDMLRQRFTPLVSQAVAATAPDGADWADRALGRLAGLVRIRRVGDLPGETTEARLARAEQRLNENNLAAAVREVEGLQGAAAETLRPWLEAARGRLAAEAALVALMREAGK